ncbi:YopX family protein [Bacillus inaquosorum]|uniref:YopX family protein n=1 Tax=Bacillus inaquosorum TaxID=483913 RepID=UPI00227E0629|nr:YopX family protein [Bacillus inaquosorum]MCY8083151.1 YopX family protein [Bacillus inaquosorum]MCY8174877.1 YopX family protein [Bacillus inaquosorum]
MNTAYRVWDGEKMHYWDDGELSLIISGGEWGLYRNIVGALYPIRIASSKQKNSDLMWGTGLNDKKGKDIYQKDITEESYINPMSKENIIDRYVIERKNGFDRMEHVSGKEGFYRYLWLRSDEVEVIGDVYRNPELLEGAE